MNILLMAAAQPPPPPFLLSTSSYLPTFLTIPNALFSLFFFTFSLSLLIFLKINRNKTSQRKNDKPTIKISSFSHPSLLDINENSNESNDKNSSNSNDSEEAIKDYDSNSNIIGNGCEFDAACESGPTHSLLLSFLPSDSAKWDKLFADDGCVDDKERAEAGQDVCLAEKGQQQGKKKKKRAKKKRPDLGNGEEDRKKEEEGAGGGLGVVSECPFTTSSSATQRKIKQQYDQLVKSHQSNGLTLAQVGQFVTCLVEARNELQNKSEIIQRRFTITKALLLRADRSCFDRLRQQIYKLELEQKRLEEDASVYNWLQQQLKLSPAYKKMLEIGPCMDMTTKAVELTDTDDSESDISFEELLAQEKKDTFWQRHGKPKQFSG